MGVDISNFGLPTYVLGLNSSVQAAKQPNAVGSGAGGTVSRSLPVSSPVQNAGGNYPIQDPRNPAILGASREQAWRDSGGQGDVPVGWNGSGGQAAPQSYFDASTGQTFGSRDDFMREIDNAYNPSFDYLNQAESAVRADHPSALAEAESIFNLNGATLGNQLTTGKQNLDTQKGKATTTYENALADARRVHQEQQIGAQQRFGGSSSAGQAVSEIQAREQARQFGQTNRQYTDVVNEVEGKKVQLDKEYELGKMQLEQQKQTSIANATRDFQNKLLQISQNRAQIGQAKAEARLGALQQLRSEVFAIEQQNKQFAQTLDLQRQQALLSLGNFSGASQGYQASAANTVGGFQPNASLGSSTAATGGLGGRTSQAMTGQISQRRPEDQYMGQITNDDRYRYA